VINIKGIYFFTYEYSKEKFSTHLPGPHHTTKVNILSSLIAGAITSAATSPFWVIRTRLHSQVYINK
jgi:hypothetical protein